MSLLKKPKVKCYNNLTSISKVSTKIKTKARINFKTSAKNIPYVHYALLEKNQLSKVNTPDVLGLFYNKRSWEKFNKL